MVDVYEQLVVRAAAKRVAILRSMRPKVCRRYFFVNRPPLRTVRGRQLLRGRA